MGFSLYETAWNIWHKRAKKRAMRDSEYAAEELGRQHGSFYVGSGTGEDGKEYTLEGMWAHMQRFNELCPDPWWVKVHHWRDKHRLRLRMKYNDFKWFIQRGRRGYADCDLWSLDHYLAELISKSIIHLRDIGHGYPAEFESPEEWDAILTEISEGFAQDVFEEETFDKEKFERALNLFGKYFHNLWD